MCSLVAVILSEVHRELVEDTNDLSVGLAVTPSGGSLSLRFNRGESLPKGNTKGSIAEKYTYYFSNKNKFCKPYQQTPRWLIAQRDRIISLLDQLLREGSVSITCHDLESSDWFRACRDMAHLVSHNKELFSFENGVPMLTWDTVDSGEVIPGLTPQRQVRTITVKLSWLIKVNVSKLKEKGVHSLNFWRQSPSMACDIAPLTLSSRLLEILAKNYGVNDSNTVLEHEPCDD